MGSVSVSQKKPRGRELTVRDKRRNRALAQQRVTIEHVLASIKRCRIVKDVFRNTRPETSDLAILLACGLHNWRLLYRKSAWKH